MKDEAKTKKQLMSELNELRQYVADLQSAEEELKWVKESQQKFTKAFMQNSIPMGITTLKEGRFVEVSGVFLKLMGLERDKVIGNTSTGIGFITDEQRTIFFNELNKKGRVENLELQVRTKGGEARYGLFNAVMMTISNEKYLLTVMTDITDRKRLEDELILSAKKYRNIFENVPVGLYRASPGGRYLDANPYAARILGYDSPEELIQSITDIGTQVYLDPKDRNEALRLLKEQGYIQSFEAEFIQKNGNTMWGSLSAKVVRDAKGNILYHEGISQDITDRKRSAEALLESEARYRAVVEDQEEMICRFLPDGTLTFVNDAYCRYFGKSKGELLGKKFLPLIPDEDREMVAKRIAALSKGKPSEMHDQRSFTASGRVCWQQWVNRALFDEQGCLTEIQAVGRDITTLKQTEERLRESEERFRSLIENMPIGIFIYEGSKFRYLNPACERITGYTREELHLKDFWEIIHPDFKETVREYVHMRQRGEPVPELHEFKIITKCGEERWVERNSISIELNGNLLVLVTVRDITERKCAEEVVRKSEEKYRAVLESASDAIILGDEYGNLIEANRMAEKLLGYTREELLQMHYTQLHPMMELEKTIAAHKDIVTHGKGGLQNGVMLRKDGTVVPVDITATTIAYDGRKVLQASFRDISEHKQTEDTLEKMVRERTAELSEKNKQLVEEIKERKHADATLRKKKKELMLHAGKLQEMNAALKVLLKQREEDKRELEEKVMANVKELLLPYLEKLKTSRLDAKDKVHVSILEANLNSIISPFTHRLSSKYSGFTPREIQVANLIRQGKSTKDIAESMGISRSAINLYRNQIRHKLGIITKKINLRSHLMAFS